jgi:hypothetical protein
MPFTTQESRVKFPDKHGVKINLDLAHEVGQPGDRCFVFYREMIQAWRASPRWTTAHELRKKKDNDLVYLGTDDRTSLNLAWDVFFNLHVMPYEIKKREENGEVE